MFKKALALLAALLLLAALGGGCSKGEEKTTVVQLHEVTHSVFYAPLYVAMGLGYFEDEGLSIVLTNSGGSDKAMTAVLAGDADIGLMGPETTVYVTTEGGREDPAKLFCQMTQKDGSFIVGHADEDFTWENLRGKTILGGRKGGAPCMTLLWVLGQNGLTPGVDVEVRTDIAFNMMGEAFAAGEADYTTLFEPAATQAEKEGYGYVLGAVGDYTEEIAYTGFVALQSTLDDNPDMISAFLRAIYRGQQFVKDSTPEEIAKAMSGQFPDNDVDVLTIVAERYKGIGAFTETPVVSEAAINNLLDVMVNAGELQDDQRPAFADFVDNTLAEKVVK